MDIQKPTVLDAARIASEMDRIRGNIISNAFIHRGDLSFLLELNGGVSFLHFLVEKRYAFLGLVREAPVADLRPIQALTGYAIVSAEQSGFDRIVKVSLEKDDRLGRKLGANLIFELIPNKGNAVLVDNHGAIKWALRKRESNRYKPPSPLKKPTVLNIEDRLAELSQVAPSEILDKIYGLNPMDIRNLSPAMRGDSSELLSAIQEYAATALKPGPAWIVRDGGDVLGYSLTRPALESGEAAEQFEWALRMYPHYYGLAAGRSIELDKRERLVSALEKEIKVQRQKLSALSDEIERARKAETYKLFGELILTHIDDIKKGMERIRLPNFEGRQPEHVEIALDPSKNAAANANDYFARFKKASSSLKILEKRLGSTREKLADLESVQNEYSDDLDRLEDALVKRGLVHGVRSAKKKVVEKRLPYKKYVAANGWEILVGRTSSDNDELTFKIARKDDYWFHAWQAAGSHTVLRLPDKNAVPDKKTLEEAASLAAYYSKARTSGKVPVAYTQAKYVRKPRNFAPGKVMVEREKQLIVRPADIKKYRDE
jgi:predicted ribosome quality control (RQC) complex YloA/Tae2 family protein